MLYKMCSRCGTLIEQSKKMCSRCMKTEKSRHAEYNEFRRDKKAAAFYLSKEWRRLRPVIQAAFNGIDVYALYVSDELILLKESDPIHHIVEVEEDWNLRLDPTNLIPVSAKTHAIITARYKDETTKRVTQTEIRNAITKHFGTLGAYKKVLADYGLVAPPVDFGEKSPLENLNIVVDKSVKF